jgi:ATP-dependent Lon protease
MSENKVQDSIYPVLPLRDIVVFPHVVVPLFVGRDKSIAALENAMATNKQILLIAQTDALVDTPYIGDLYKVGTLANILQLLKFYLKKSFKTNSFFVCKI